MSVVAVSKPSLNVVALLYQWSVLRFVRRRTAGPDEVEAAMSRNRFSRPRLVVIYLLGNYVLEIGGAFAAAAILTLIVARATADVSHSLSQTLGLVSAVFAAFPLAVTLRVWHH